MSNNVSLSQNVTFILFTNGYKGILKEESLMNK